MLEHPNFLTWILIFIAIKACADDPNGFLVDGINNLALLL